MDACSRKEPEHTPVWFMRQAGRYLPSYMRLKGGRNILEVAKDPELSSQVAVDAVESLGVDAAILFADIMLPLESIGVRFVIQENVGPVVSNPIRTRDDVRALKALEPRSDLAYVYAGIDETLRKLDGRVPLIGFSGAPFTLAAYMIEGGPSRDLERTRMLMLRQPELWSDLMTRLTQTVTSYLNEQVRHGVAAVQLFDSWAGAVSASDYSRFVLPYTRRIFASIPSVPSIHFCADSCASLEEFHRAGPDVLSVDWRFPISEVWRRCGDEVAVQGNLDPAAAATGGATMERAVKDVLKRARGHPGHVFSLGHGVLRETDPANLRRVVQIVHRATRSRR